VVSPVRPPVIAGLAPGSGTSTLAAALHARDAGVLPDRFAGEADIVVCRAGALRHAAALACSPTGPRPVLAVLLDESGREAVTPRLAAVRARFGAVTALPQVRHWRGAAVKDEAATVLALNSIYLLEPLQAYASALRVLVAALTGTGVLQRSSPPMVSRPITEGLWPGLRSAERVTPLRPIPFTPLPAPVTRPPARPTSEATNELDDEALEALLPDPPAPAGRSR
jgi:hypothetical protein